MKKEMNEKILELEIKKSDIRREKAKLVLDKSILLYFLFMLLGSLGFVYGYINSGLLNFLIVASFIILILGSLPYVTTISKEEKKINEFIEKLK